MLSRTTKQIVEQFLDNWYFSKDVENNVKTHLTETDRGMINIKINHTDDTILEMNLNRAEAQTLYEKIQKHQFNTDQFENSQKDLQITLDRYLNRDKGNITRTDLGFEIVVPYNCTPERKEELLKMFEKALNVENV